MASFGTRLWTLGGNKVLEDAKFIAKAKTSLDFFSFSFLIVGIVFLLFAWAYAFFAIISWVPLIMGFSLRLITLTYRQLYIYIDTNSFNSYRDTKRVCRFLGIKRGALAAPYRTMNEIFKVLEFKVDDGITYSDPMLLKHFILFLNQNYLKSDSTILSRKRAKKVIPLLREALPQYYSGAGATVAKKPEQECVADGPIQTLQNEYERIFGQSNSYEAKNERTVINYNSLQTTDLQVAKRELEKAFSERYKSETYNEMSGACDIISSFLSQYERFEVQEARLNQLIAFSGATYLDSITESFSEIRCLFEENARVIMHYLIVDGYADTDAKVNIQLADRHEREVEEMVADNNDVIKSVDALLDKAAQLVNKFNSEESKKPRTEDILASLKEQTELLERMSTRSFRLDE